MSVGEDFVRRLEQNVNALKISLQLLDTNLTDPIYSEVEYKIELLLFSIEEFYTKILLHPQLNLDNHQLEKLENAILLLQQELTGILDALSPKSLTDKAQWILDRFFSEDKFQDRAQKLVSFSVSLHKFLNTAFFNQIEKSSFLALVIEVVGWSEHLATQGSNDPNSVILFGAKIAKDLATIQSRIELAQKICSQLQEFSIEEIGQSFSKDQLHFYSLLLEDLEVIVASSEDSDLFKTYCEESAIEIYEEYQDIIKKRLTNYARNFPFNLHTIIEKLNTATIISSAEQLIRQYEQVRKPTDAQGLDLKVDEYILEGIIRNLGEAYPTLLLRCQALLERIRQLQASS